MVINHLECVVVEMIWNDTTGVGEGCAGCRRHELSVSVDLITIHAHATCVVGACRPLEVDVVRRGGLGDAPGGNRVRCRVVYEPKRDVCNQDTGACVLCADRGLSVAAVSYVIDRSTAVRVSNVKNKAVVDVYQDLPGIRSNGSDCRWIRSPNARRVCSVGFGITRSSASQSGNSTKA